MFSLIALGDARPDSGIGNSLGYLLHPVDTQNFGKCFCLECGLGYAFFRLKSDFEFHFAEWLREGALVNPVKRHRINVSKTRKFHNLFSQCWIAEKDFL